MPVVAKCPNCNGPLDKAPGGPDSKCPYCNATLLATTYMPSPAAAPGPVLGVPPGGVPYPPAAGQGWGTPAVGAPGAYPPSAPMPLPPMPVFHTRKRSSAGALVSIVISFVVFGGIGIGVYFMQRQVQQTAEQATQAATQAAEERTAQVRIGPMPLVAGEELEINLPSSMNGPGGRVVTTLTMDLPEEQAHEISLRGGAAYIQCRVKALDASDKALAKSVTDDDHAQIYAPLPKGKSSIIVDCDSYPGERSVYVLARPLPILTTGEQAAFVIEPGMESAGAAVVPAEAGHYAIALLCDDVNTSLQVLGERDALVGKADVDSSTHRAVLEADLQNVPYLIQALRSSAASQKIQVTVALTAAAPEPIPMDTDVNGVLSRWVPNVTYAFTLGAESRISVTLNSSSFDHAVELRRADGVSVASSGEESARERARVAPNLPLAAGEYRIIVTGDDYSISEGEFTLRVEAVVEPPPPPTKRRVR
ncbi:MAG: hypothetical protein HY905_05615 [Deltaproteobacteria bacterium]|nr:hypothetical protein [Deltaproteobacteria bacterium]